MKTNKIEKNKLYHTSTRHHTLTSKTKVGQHSLTSSIQSKAYLCPPLAKIVWTKLNTSVLSVHMFSCFYSTVQQTTKLIQNRHTQTHGHYTLYTTCTAFYIYWCTHFPWPSYTYVDTCGIHTLISCTDILLFSLCTPVFSVY